MSPTSTLTSLCEDADSGDNGLSTISVTDYIPHVQGDKYRVGCTTYIEDPKSHVMPLRNTITEQCVGLYTDPSIAPCSSISSSSMGSTLEHEKAFTGNLLGSNSGLIEEAGGSQSPQSNWQIPFDENTGPIPRWSLTESFGLEFESDYSTPLFGGETDNAIPEIYPDLFTSNGELKDQSVQQKFSKQPTDAQSQYAPGFDTDYKLPREESVSYPLTAKHALLDGEENLKKVDSFSRWITKELAEVDDLHLQTSPGISWSTDECGHVIDDTSLNPSLSQDQLFSINDFSPKWTYADSEIERANSCCSCLHGCSSWSIDRSKSRISFW
ncbi:hypothetical protein PIB30_116823 [Stylosanthes scabra]|uniref:Uncharacterized protein n=1 Tax=Stylosanthes scabra TaxID=79078 RepID=A0ABU6VD38_9FABA|nr:hypothetical protein [Stylosanthes scabra]